MDVDDKHMSYAPARAVSYGMEYKIYLHNDLDGTASAALLYYFFKHRGESVKEFIPIDYTPGLREGWSKRKLGPGAVIVDFIYHPDADWWFDHHKAPFVEKKWQKGFKQGGQYFWDAEAPSCCGLIMRTLEKEYNFKFPAYINKLVKGVDKIDSAAFKTIGEALELRSPISKIALSLDYSQHDAAYRTFIAKKMAELPLEEIVKLPRVKEYFEMGKQEVDYARKYYKKNVKLHGRTTFIDVMGKVKRSPFFSPYFYPNSIYNVEITDRSNGKGPAYHLSIRTNIARKSQAKIDVSEITKKYNGGGHRYVGGAEFADRAEARGIAEKLIKILNKNA